MIKKFYDYPQNVLINICWIYLPLSPPYLLNRPNATFYLFRIQIETGTFYLVGMPVNYLEMYNTSLFFMSF